MSNEEQVEEQATDLSKYKIPGAIALVAILILGFVLTQDKEEPAPPPPVVKQPEPPKPEPVIAPEPEPEPEPVVSEPEPLPEPEPEPEPAPEPKIVLPAIDESDEVVRKDILGLTWDQNLPALFLSEDLIRKGVIFIDNLSHGNVERDFSVVKGPVQRFSVLELDGKTYIDPASFDRYNLYVAILESFNANDLRGLYEKYSPLVHEVYGELGYPEKDFKEAMILAIDMVLETPDTGKMIEVVSPKVMYQYADEELETASDLQKQVMRMGPENVAKVKDALRKLRRALIAE